MRSPQTEARRAMVLHMRSTRVGDHGIGGFPRIVCLCGSMRFWPDHERLIRHLTRKGLVVLHAEPSALNASEAVTDPGAKAVVQSVHRHRLELADEVYVVVDSTGYFGPDTRADIEYAHELMLPMRMVRPGELP